LSLCCAVLQLGDVAAFEVVIKQLIADSNSSSIGSPSAAAPDSSSSSIAAAVVDESALTAAARGPAPTSVPAAAAAGFQPASAAAAVAAIPALGVVGDGRKHGWLVGCAAAGADVELVLLLQEKLGALLSLPQVSFFWGAGGGG
jgi:hypothetical protein